MVVPEAAWISLSPSRRWRAGMSSAGAPTPPQAKSRHRGHPNAGLHCIAAEGAAAAMGFVLGGCGVDRCCQEGARLSCTADTQPVSGAFPSSCCAAERPAAAMRL